ncbi:PREDICTED: spectrin beta chain-like [Priapulus caudatus]|uniref:Spectrin beta chain-like n=1 Tax=Priapulus caudatus TaxID=37621 RepID=A0ABM1DSF1_PRICU|nr:PREDICTED: spectrin beta chain-like [Priapulus caudatus]
MSEYVDLGALTGKGGAPSGRKYHSLPRGRRRHVRTPNPFCVIDLSQVQCADDFGSSERLSPTYGLQGAFGRWPAAGGSMATRRSVSASDLTAHGRRRTDSGVVRRGRGSTGTSIVDVSAVALRRQASRLSINVELDVRFIDAEYRENTVDVGTGDDLRNARLDCLFVAFSDQIAVRQSQVDRLYAGLKDLAQERKAKLDETLKLYMLNREVDDLLTWIAEREVVAGSHELGQDFEHVCMLQERFREFARNTEAIGTERVAAGNEIADALINVGHSDAALIAQWKDQLNEAWTDLLELIDTRTQILASSYELHKYYHDCKDCLGMIQEKQNSMSEELGRDTGSVSALQRKHANFEQDLTTLAGHVQAVQEKSNKLQAVYAGDKAREIQNRETEVVNAWRNLQSTVDARRNKLVDTSDLLKFFMMVRDLMLWMEEIVTHMNTQEKPRDVSGVELLMNNHQSLKNEIDAREENVDVCVALGQTLLSRRHYASDEIRDKLLGLTNQRTRMMEQWEHRWEHLQLVLEVFQFARDAAVAESWLFSMEPYLGSEEMGRSLDEVEILIKKHEAFEKSAIAQEDRFTALARLTTMELRDQHKRIHKETVRLSRMESEYSGYELKELRRRQEEEEERNRAQQRQIEEQLEQERKEREAAEAAVRKTESTRASGDSGTAAVPAEGPPSPQGAAEAESGDAHMESMLVRKHDLTAGGKKATSRSWEKLFTVLRGPRLSFFKDQKHAKQEGAVPRDGPLDLRGGEAEVASDYIKKKHVYRLKLSDGSIYLFQAKDDSEMDFWIRTINSAREIAGTPTSPSRAQTLPIGSEKKEEPKKRSFFTLKK